MNHLFGAPYTVLKVFVRLFNGLWPAAIPNAFAGASHAEGIPEDARAEFAFCTKQVLNAFSVKRD